jgi:poly(ADP-ribose) glycohydrolase ARH3
MRVAPVGVFYARDLDRLRDEAARSARVTHASRQAVAGAVAQAAPVAAAVRGESPLEAALAEAATSELRFALRRVADGLEQEWAHPEAAAELGTEATALRSVPAAVYAATRARSFEDACTFAVQMGGDTDTIAAMAGAVAGARFGATAIPQRWLDPLEDGVRGRSHVERLARRLVES